MEIRVVSTTDRTTDTVEIALAAGAGSVIAAPPAGRELRVSLGYRETGLVEMGSYWHTETDVELAPVARVVLRATGADLRRDSGIKARRTRAWHDVTLGEVASAIAAEHGLAVHVDGAVAPKHRPHIDQTAESDLHLLQRLSVEYDAVVKVVGPNLIVAKAASGRSAAGAAMPTLTITPVSGALSARVAYRERPQVAAVRASYWRIPLAEPLYAIAGDGDPLFDLPDPYEDAATAQAAADAALARAVRATASVEASVVGDPRISAGCPVATSGWPVEAANGRWIATRVTHTLTATSYTTDVDATAPS